MKTIEARILSLMLLPPSASHIIGQQAFYTADKEMEKLGTAAVHLLTMANSYISAQKEKERVQPRQSAEP